VGREAEEAPQPDREVVEERVGDGGGEQGEQQGERLAADDDEAGGAVLPRAGAAGDDQGDHAGDEGERGHEDGAQPVAVGLEDGLEPRHAAGAQLQRVVDLQDRVLLHDAEEHEHAGHREDVDRLAEENDRQDGEGHRQRQREQDGDRVQPRLELGGEHQVHEDERQAEGEEEVLRGAPELARDARRGDGVARLEAHVAGEALQLFDDGALRVALFEVGRDDDVALAVLPVDARGARAGGEVDDLVEGDRAELGRGHADEAQPVGVGAGVGQRAHEHVVPLALLVVARDLVAADEQAQGVGHVGDADAEVGGLAAVDVGAHLGLAEHERSVGVDDAGQLPQPGEQPVGVVGDLRELAPLHHELNGRVGVAAAREGGHGRDRGAQALGLEQRREPAPALVDEVLLRDAALARRPELDVHAAQVRRLLRVVADGDHGVPHAGQLLDLGGDARADQARAVEAGALGGAEGDLELRLVFDGQEVGAGGPGEQRRRAERGEAREHHRPAVRHAPAQGAQVAALDRAVEPRVAAARPGRLRPQKARREARRQREADDERHDDGERHREAERAHEPADDAVHQRHRREDGDQRQRRGEHRQADLARALDGGHRAALAARLHAVVDVLEHDDGVVDDDADGEREREQRERVEREAGGAHQPERADDARGDGDGGDERRAHVAQEQKHDGGGEHRAEHQVLLHRPDRVLDELRLVARDVDRVAGGQLRPQFGEALFDPPNDLDRVGAALLAHVEQHRRLAALVPGRLGLGHAVFDRRDVAQPHRVALARGDDELAERLDRLDPAARAQRERAAALLDAPGRNFDVLRGERPIDVDDREPEFLQPRRVDEHVNLPPPAAQDGHLADAADGLEPAAQDLVGELGDVAHVVVRRQGERQHGGGVGVELGDRGRVDARRQRRQDLADLVAHLLGGDLDVFLEDERDVHLADALDRDRAQLVDAADGVDGGLELVGNLELDLFGGRAGRQRRDGDGGEVDLGKSVEAEPSVRKGPHHRQDENDDRREDRASDANLGEPLHELCAFRDGGADGLPGQGAATSAPSLSAPTFSTTTSSPGPTLPVTATRSPACLPTMTSRSETRPPARTNTREAEPVVPMAADGTTVTFSFAPFSTTEARAKRPGRNSPRSLRTSASTGSVRDCARTLAPMRLTTPSNVRPG
jgi:hypothetical protein